MHCYGVSRKKKKKKTHAHTHAHGFGNGKIKLFSSPSISQNIKEEKARVGGWENLLCASRLNLFFFFQAEVFLA